MKARGKETYETPGIYASNMEQAVKYNGATHLSPFLCFTVSNICDRNLDFSTAAKRLQNLEFHTKLPTIDNNDLCNYYLEIKVYYYLAKLDYSQMLHFIVSGALILATILNYFETGKQPRLTHFGSPSHFCFHC